MDPLPRFEPSPNHSSKPGSPRVLWDMTFTTRTMTGTRVYTHNLYDALLRVSDWNFVKVYGSSETNTHGRGKLQGNLQNIAWLFGRAEKQAKQMRPDLYHSAAYLGPWRLPCPGVLNVFDTSYLAYPHQFDWRWKMYARTVIPNAVKHASAVLTLSEHARGEIVRAYNLPCERVHIVAPGIGAEFRPVSDPIILQALRAKYELADNYVLYVGARHPRKNLPALVRALEMVRGKHPDLQFVIAGPVDRNSEPLPDLASVNGRPALRQVDFVPQQDLAALYSGARAFFYASKLEGFGIPPVEAMACGTPVVTAPNPPMPEVLGDAALYTDDDSPSALAQGMLRLLSDAALAQELRERGISRARMYTWENAAHKTLGIYQEILARSKRFDA